jgi:hypothetical protein
MNKEMEYLKKFAGEWVLLFKDEVIMHGTNLEDILKEAKDYPEDEVTLCKVPPKNYFPIL